MKANPSSFFVSNFKLKNSTFNGLKVELAMKNACALSLTKNMKIKFLYLLIREPVWLELLTEDPVVNRLGLEWSTSLVRTGMIIGILSSKKCPPREIIERITSLSVNKVVDRFRDIMLSNLSLWMKIFGGPLLLSAMKRLPSSFQIRFKLRTSVPCLILKTKFWAIGMKEVRLSMLNHES